MMATRVFLVFSLVLTVCSQTPGDEAVPPKAKAKKAVPVKAVPAKKVKVVVIQAEARKKLLEAQQAATKKLAEAQQTAKEATQALAEVEKAAAEATDPKQKQESAEKVAAAKQKLEKAQKELAKRRDEVRKAAVKARAGLFVRRFPGGNVAGVRKTVDRQDSHERFLLLSSGGPVVVEVALHLDGKPFRVAREELIDELLAAADTDQDGKATWEEAVKNPHFTMGRIRATNGQQVEQLIAGFDTNKNKLVDRDEIRQFVARYFGGPAFTLSGNNRNRFFGGVGIVVINGAAISRSQGGSADVQKLLDTDEDGVLSEKEIAEAGDRLKSKDSDDNDLLYPTEINGAPAAANNNIRVIRTFSARQSSQQAVMLGPTVTAESLFAALTQRYKQQDGSIVVASFSAVPKLFTRLDKNSNGKLEKDEVLDLNNVQPHIQMEVHLGKTKGPQGVSLKSLAAELTKSGKAGVELPGIKIDFQANLSTPAAVNYDQMGQRYLTRYDANGNGYLEKKEIPAGLATQFDLWDADKDGKVYSKEIAALYKRQRAPYKTQVRASAASDGNALFRTLDMSGDGRLSLREMKTAHVQIKTLDKNNDGRIEAAEVPASITVGFSQGNTGFNSFRAIAGNRPGANRPAGGDAPEWFTRMDRNGDGDVTLREFLGTKEGFKKLDTNGDGFIEVKEAKAAQKAQTSKPKSEKK